VAGGIKSAFDTYEDNKQRQVWNDRMFDYLAKNVPGSVAPDVLARYHEMSPREKNREILSAQFIADKMMAKQQAEDAHRLTIARLKAADARMMEGDFKPEIVTMRPPGEEPFNVLRSTPNQYLVTPGSRARAGQTELTPEQKLAADARQRQVDNIDQNIASESEKLARGERYSGEFLGLGGTPREKVIEGLRAKRAVLSQGAGDLMGMFGRPSAPPPLPVGAIPADQAMPGGPVKSPAAPAAQYRPGMRVRQGGKIYEFDGANWNLVQ
jgi:hypothetical protein